MITVLKCLSYHLWSFTKSIFWSINKWLILKIVCWEQFNEVLYPFFTLTILAASSTLLHSLLTSQICSHPAESLYVLQYNVFCFFSSCSSFAQFTFLAWGLRFHCFYKYVCYMRTALMSYGQKIIPCKCINCTVFKLNL